MQQKSNIVKFNKVVTADDPKLLIDFLVKYVELSKQKMKTIMSQGGVWLTQKKRKRIRKVQTSLLPGNRVEFYYDPNLIFASEDQIQCLHDAKTWTLWFKPAGVISQGTDFGDAGSILRHVETKYRETYLVHRLDRETSGLMLFAHTGKMAAELSQKIQNHKIRKFYLAEVLGKVEKAGEISKPLEGKPAQTLYKVLKQNEHTTQLEIEITTGRTHQIRLHMEGIGHPVMGDPRYGKGNKNTEGLRLQAHKLIVDGQTFQISNEQLIFPL
ncbi:MAG: RNA pseudouridine synthase [Bacteriovoracaceae bacterium]|nr:RNA pseudouridine synthase [Bacteriovoracaceae bacterium]